MISFASDRNLEMIVEVPLGSLLVGRRPQRCTTNLGLLGVSLTDDIIGYNYSANECPL